MEKKKIDLPVVMEQVTHLMVLEELINALTVNVNITVRSKRFEGPNSKGVMYKKSKNELAFSYLRWFP